MAEFVASIDQGTTSTRCMIFNHNGLEVGRHQLEHEQILPRPGWVEHNPTEIWGRTQTVVTSALNNTNLKATDIAALAILPIVRLAWKYLASSPGPATRNPFGTRTFSR